MTLALIAVCVLATVLVFVCAALVEVFSQLRDLREVTELDDRASPLTLAEDAERDASALGLPEGLVEAPRAAVILLSSSCAVCGAIAKEIGSSVVPTVWYATADDDPRSRVTAALVHQEDRLLPDMGERLRMEMGIDIVPSMLLFEAGTLRHAYAVGSVRQARAVIPAVHHASPPARAAHAMSGHDREIPHTHA